MAFPHQRSSSKGTKVPERADRCAQYVSVGPLNASLFFYLSKKYVAITSRPNHCQVPNID